MATKPFMQEIRILSLLLLLLWPFGMLLSGQSIFRKCAPDLLTDSRSTEPTLFQLVLHDADAFELERQKLAGSVQVIRYYRPANIVVVQTTVPVLRDRLLPMPGVLFADRFHRTAREELLVPGHNLSVNNIGFVHDRQPALDGSGTTISIKEFRFDSSDVDFKNRFLSTSKSAFETSVHAGIIATLVAGAGNSGPAGRGVARGSRLVSSSFAGLLPDDPGDYTGFEITVQNHAYGVDIESYYGAGAVAFDASTRDQPELLHVFSAGNSGAAMATSGTYANLNGFANLTGNFKMAKNVLLVGATDSFKQVLPFSSHGPAYDGRVKPDLVAFGQDGSSESAALVSGAAAVIRQAFFEVFGFWPASSVLRAVLVGTAEDLGPAGPDFISGYGNLNLKKAVEVIQPQSVKTDTVTAGETRVFTVGLPSGIRQFKVTLCWNDPPALPNAGTALINDLDLSVTMPDGTISRPWALHTNPSPDSLLLPAGRGRDSLNTIEQVALDMPKPGLYQVFVTGNAIPIGKQVFALVFSQDLIDHFEWTCPVKNAPVLAGREAILRWESTGSGNGVLEWKPTGTDQWRLIEQAAELTAGYLRWLVPDTFVAAQLRMRIAGTDFVSDTFLIASDLTIQLVFNCPDSLFLRWKATAAGASYRIWGLGEQYLEPLRLTSDTFAVLQKIEFPQERFAVSAVDGGQTVDGLYDCTPDIAAPGNRCYINTLLALLNSMEQVDVQLTIGELYGIRKIRLEKWKQDAWVLLLEEDPVSIQVLCTDMDPAAGVNTYRARLQMLNGEYITSAPVSVYFSGGNGFLVFPNPARPGDILQVLSKPVDETPEFKLTNLLGERILERPLENTEEKIPLPDLPPGYYIWTIAGASFGRSAHGKLLIRQ